MKGPDRDPWAPLDRLTPARIALGRAGASLPTRAVLDFSLAHAKARDAVHARLDTSSLAGKLAPLGLPVIEVSSRAPDRQLYLRRPDLGRTLDDASAARFPPAPRDGIDLVIVLADGLSATAVAAHAPALLDAFAPLARAARLSLGPLVIASGARVALGDDIGARLGARLAAIVIGERPGLSADDSLGIYLTFAPSPGRTDAERNCISNVRPAGLPPERAARSLAWLVTAALARGETGIGLKDQSDAGLPPAPRPAPQLGDG